MVLDLGGIENTSLAGGAILQSRYKQPYLCFSHLKPLQHRPCRNKCACEPDSRRLRLPRLFPSSQPFLSQCKKSAVRGRPALRSDLSIIFCAIFMIKNMPRIFKHITVFSDTLTFEAIFARFLPIADFVLPGTSAHCAWNRACLTV